MGPRFARGPIGFSAGRREGQRPVALGQKASSQTRVSRMT